MRLPKPETIDAYLATVSPAHRAALERLRKTIRSIMPAAEECISYSIPAFRYRGQVVAGFLARRTGCSYVPFSGTTLATLAAEVAAYAQTKSALHFELERSLPVALVRKLLKARIAEGEESGRGKAKAQAKGAAKKKAPTRSSGGPGAKAKN